MCKSGRWLKLYYTLLFIGRIVADRFLVCGGVSNEEYFPSYIRETIARDTIISRNVVRSHHSMDLPETEISLRMHNAEVIHDLKMLEDAFVSDCAL